MKDNLTKILIIAVGVFIGAILWTLLVKSAAEKAIADKTQSSPLLALLSGFGGNNAA